MWFLRDANGADDVGALIEMADPGGAECPGARRQRSNDDDGRDQPLEPRDGGRGIDGPNRTGRRVNAAQRATPRASNSSSEPIGVRVTRRTPGSEVKSSAL